MEANNKKVRERLSRYLKNKRVVIVGPASCVIGSQQKDLIESYDVVVRLNKAFPVPTSKQDDIGIRTDILYNCMNPEESSGGKIDTKLVKQKGVKFLVGAYPPLEKVGDLRMRLKKDVMDFFAKHRMRFHDFCYTDRNHFLQLWRHMRLPNTGLMAITDLLRFPIKELYITGITFFKGGYDRDYRDYDEEGILEHMNKFGLHKPDKQLKYFINHLIKDKRIKCDPTLQEIVDQELAHTEPTTTEPTTTEPTTTEPTNTEPTTTEPTNTEPISEPTEEPQEQTTEPELEYEDSQDVDIPADIEADQETPDEEDRPIKLEPGTVLTTDMIYRLAANSATIYKS